MRIIQSSVRSICDIIRIYDSDSNEKRNLKFTNEREDKKNLSQ